MCRRGPCQREGEIGPEREREGGEGAHHLDPGTTTGLLARSCTGERRGLVTWRGGAAARGGGIAVRAMATPTMP